MDCVSVPSLRVLVGRTLRVVKRRQRALESRRLQLHLLLDLDKQRACTACHLPPPPPETGEHAVANARTEQDDAAAGQRRKALLDDVLLPLKRRKKEDDFVEVGKVGPSCHVRGHAPRGLSAFTNKTVSGCRIHALPRRRLYGHRRHKAKNWSLQPTCLLTMKQRERTQPTDEEWVDCALIFSRTGQSEMKKQEVDSDTGDGMMNAYSPYRCTADVRSWLAVMQDVLDLRTLCRHARCAPFLKLNTDIEAMLSQHPISLNDKVNFAAKILLDVIFSGLVLTPLKLGISRLRTRIQTLTLRLRSF